MRVGSLFSGIGGFDLGLERAGMEITFQVERDEYCRKVLQKHWPKVPCHYDITTIDWEFIKPVDLVCGGFPCQPFSAAGKRRGADDDRYLWPEVVRCLAVLRPTWFLGENVYGLLHLGIEQMYADLEALGYQVAILGIPACAVDAPHLRKRIWILAHTESDGWGPRGTECKRQQRSSAFVGNSGHVADAAQFMQHGGGGAGQTRWSESPDGGANVADSDQQSMGRSTKPWGQRRQWPAESDVGRVVARLSYRVDGGRLNGTSQIGGTGEILRALREGVSAKDLQWPVRGLGRVQTTKGLLAELCEYEGKAKPLGNVSLASKETSQTVMRGVWFDGTSACSSCRREAREQRSVKFPDIVHLLSRLLACDCGSTWLDPTGTPSESSRVDRLRGLGNAVVPQIVEALGRMIMEADLEIDACAGGPGRSGITPD